MFEKLKGIPLERQEKILRWVCEELGIALPTKYIDKPTAAPAPADDIPSPADIPTPTLGQPVVDIKTFIASKKPRSDQQFTAAVAYYHRFLAKPEERRDTITAKFLQDASRLARGGALHSPKTTLSNTRKAGLLDRAGRGEFRINTVGENLVAMTLPGDGAEAAPKPRPRRKRPAKNSSAKKKR